MGRHDHISKLKKNPDIRISDLDPKKPFYIKLRNATFREVEVEKDYAWYFKYVLAPDEQTDVIKCEDQDDFDNEPEPENDNENEDEDVDENDKDPQYRMFLENLTEHGKSYKLKISQNDEEPRYLYYEEPDDSDGHDELQTGIDNSGDELTVPEDLQINQISTKKEATRSKKINNHKTLTLPDQGMIVDPCYQMFVNRSIPSVPVAVKSEENLLEYEKNVTTSDSDSDIVMLDNVQNYDEVNNKQLVLAETESSLREKLLRILKQPYNDKEYDELSEYINQKKPMCRHLDLRGRSVSTAFGGVEKSVLDDGPGSFRRAFDAAQNDPPKALNLLRMFCFWLEHVPNEDFCVPWRDKCMLKVRPSEKKTRILDK